MSVATCSIPMAHSPAFRTVEFHHVVPVAWQLKMSVKAPPAPGPDTAGRGLLWDTRGVGLCPTHHRNVHTWIVALMREVSQLGVEDPEKALAALTGQDRRRRELPIALLALTRTLDAAGPVSLLTLVAEHEWGES